MLISFVQGVWTDWAGLLLPSLASAVKIPLQYRRLRRFPPRESTVEDGPVSGLDLSIHSIAFHHPVGISTCTLPIIPPSLPTPAAPGRRLRYPLALFLSRSSAPANHPLLEDALLILPWGVSAISVGPMIQWGSSSMQTGPTQWRRKVDGNCRSRLGRIGEKHIKRGGFSGLLFAGKLFPRYPRFPRYQSEPDAILLCSFPLDHPHHGPNGVHLGLQW
jgi:hypothetical protein